MKLSEEERRGIIRHLESEEPAPWSLRKTIFDDAVDHLHGVDLTVYGRMPLPTR